MSSVKWIKLFWNNIMLTPCKMGVHLYCFAAVGVTPTYYANSFLISFVATVLPPTV